MKSHYISPSLSGRIPDMLRYAFSEEEFQISLVIRDAILKRELQPGNRITTIPFEEAFDISRTLVTRVFIQLTEIGILRRRDTLTLVSKPEGAELYALFETWSAMSRHLVQSIIQKGRLSDAEKDRILVHIEVENSVEHKDFNDFSRLHGEIYLIISEILGSPNFARFFEKLSLLVFLALDGGVPSRGLSEDVGTAILRRDLEGALSAAEYGLRACEAICRSKSTPSSQLDHIVRNRIDSP